MRRSGHSRMTLVTRKNFPNGHNLMQPDSVINLPAKWVHFNGHNETVLVYIYIYISSAEVTTAERRIRYNFVWPWNSSKRLTAAKHSNFLIDLSHWLVKWPMWRFLYNIWAKYRGIKARLSESWNCFRKSDGYATDRVRQVVNHA